MGWWLIHSLWFMERQEFIHAKLLLYANNQRLKIPGGTCGVPFDPNNIENKKVIFFLQQCLWPSIFANSSPYLNLSGCYIYSSLKHEHLIECWLQSTDIMTMQLHQIGTNGHCTMYIHNMESFKWTNQKLTRFSFFTRMNSNYAVWENWLNLWFVIT